MLDPFLCIGGDFRHTKKQMCISTAQRRVTSERSNVNISKLLNLHCISLRQSSLNAENYKEFFYSKFQITSNAYIFFVIGYRNGIEGKNRMNRIYSDKCVHISNSWKSIRMLWRKVTQLRLACTRSVFDWYFHSLLLGSNGNMPAVNVVRTCATTHTQMRSPIPVWSWKRMIVNSINIAYHLLAEHGKLKTRGLLW